MTTLHNISDNDAQDLMQRFGAAYVKGDKAGLAPCLTGDFVWHLHEGPDAPNGKTVKGLEGLIDVLSWRKQHWRNVRYTDVRISTDGLQIIQTFRVSGVDERVSPSTQMQSICTLCETVSWRQRTATGN